MTARFLLPVAAAVAMIASPAMAAGTAAPKHHKAVKIHKKAEKKAPKTEKKAPAKTN